MLDSLVAWFTPLPPVHVATTDAERAGIYRLRYRIHVDELGFGTFPGADPARRWITSPSDVEPTTTLLYTGAAGEPAAALRLQIWQPGAIPPEVRAKYTMDRFPDLETRVVAVVTGLVAAKDLRGTTAVVALTGHGVALGVRDHGVEILFAECRPGLLRAYRRLGLRPYGGRPIVIGGLVVPIVAITRDLDHLARVGSPWLSILRQLDRKGQLPTRDHRPLVAVVAGPGGVESDPGQVASDVVEAMRDKEGHFLQLLSEGVRERIVRSGFILDVEPDVEVLSAGIASRELFVVLDGICEVTQDGAHLNTLGPGDVFGEIAFFHDGKRTANVVARSAGRLLVLRPRALEELAARHPRDAVEIYRALAGVLAERLAAR